MQMAITFMAVVGGMILSLAVACWRRNWFLGSWFGCSLCGAQ